MIQTSLHHHFHWLHGILNLLHKLKLWLAIHLHICILLSDESERDCHTEVDLLYTSIHWRVGGCLNGNQYHNQSSTGLYFWYLSFASLDIFESSGALRGRSLRWWGLFGCHIRYWGWRGKGQEDRELGRVSLTEHYLFRQEFSLCTGKPAHSQGCGQEAPRRCVPTSGAGLCWLPGFVRVLAACRRSLQKVISQNGMFFQGCVGILHQRNVKWAQSQSGWSSFHF